MTASNTINVRRPTDPSALSMALLVAVPGLFYLMSMMLRNSMAVVEVELERAFALSATEAGILAAALFVAFAIAQIPLGIAMDRVGPLRVLGFSILMLVGGALAFAAADGFAALLGARIAIGIGAAPIYVAIMGLISARVSADRFSTYSGMESGIGRLGFLVAAAPFAWLASAVGWRTGYGLSALLTVLLGVAMLISLRHAAWTPGEATNSWQAMRTGVRRVARAPGVAGLVAFQIGMTGASVVLFAGWGASWLRSVYAFTGVEAAQFLTLAACSFAAGSLVWGAAPKLAISAVTVSLVGGLVLAGLLALPAAGLLGRPWLPMWLILFGLVSAGYPLAVAQMREWVPKELLVRGITLLSFSAIGGAGVLLAASGALIDMFADAPGEHPPESFKAMFALLAGVNLVTTLSYGIATRRRSVTR
ncbi:MFS transporter [Thiocapsa sp.]|uniref:MFS transporter n=1 Tax=Thiocapsa sp. TaxID=2024551 RepID=UPI0025CB8B4E|nr:MFS transporter [Thiocapsa sp.]